jgi:predicted RNase H-like HicB family nuclease/DNA-binding XRE family transcriptional regulator
MKYNFRVYDENTILWAECAELPGCNTQGKNLEELKQNAFDALNLYLDEPQESNLIFPLPKKGVRKGENSFEVQVEPQIAFSILLRHLRISRGLTQKAMAERLGIVNLYSYQRLEKKANPTIGTIQKIKEALPEFPVEIVFN